MAVIQDIIAALWQHDFAALANPHVVSVVYFVMFATLFLEKRSAASVILTWR
ncbi:DedA family integral membrane protein [Salmonella enterica subsp. enterica]|nr:DedA family integral membrane protein [Salmonella enterica subsp. enterica]